MESQNLYVLALKVLLQMIVVKRVIIVDRLRSPTCSPWKNQKAEDRFHVATVAWIGKTIQTEQVPKQTEEIWSGHLVNAYGNTGEQWAFYQIKYYKKIHAKIFICYVIKKFIENYR